ncbi:hypothetical protein F511_38465 [Dorcoceras hygrometricum]|uniref:Dystroglycan-like n=1 Tax=Dorcoceras hygrometricum TaxID=472368 RepID=A0A2Z7BXH3_9LAMI|nr:hypothetical protein F511_38465 [Dorcoceras hygrometricum]
MASSLFTNTVHICFDSVLAMDNPGMVLMFEALMASGLKGFLGCPTILYEAALVEFFENASIRDGVVISTVGDKQVEISEELFASSFELSVDALTDLSDVPKDIVFDVRSIFSLSGEQMSSSGKKREMKIEFRLLSDILVKTISVKAGYFDAVTRERFLMMTAINGGVKINWSRLLFNIFKDMVTPGSKEAKDSKEFPASKILADKTVHRYIAVNDKLEVEDVSRVKKTPVKRAVSRKRPAAVDEPVVKKKRTCVGKASSVTASTALEAVPIQTVAPISTMPPSAPNVKFRRGREDVVDEGISTADDVDNIIEQVIAETAQLETEEEVTVVSRPNVGDQEEPRADDMEHWFNLSYEEFVSSDTNRRFETASDTDGEPETVVQEETVQTAVVEKKTDDESLSLEETLLKISEDSVLPSVAGEITKIQFSKGISIKGVNEGDWYKASLPKIPANAKGKAPLKTVDPVRGNPAKEIFTLICVDVDFLVQKQEKIIDEVEQFFNSYSFRRMAALNPTEFYAKEEMVLSWAGDMALGDSKEFPASKILAEKTVHRYIAVNDKLEVEDVSRVKKTPVKRAVSRKRPAAVDEPVVKKKRTCVGKASSVIASPALEAVPIQTVAPISTMPPSAPNVKFIRGREVAIENPVPADADVVDEGISTADDVDNIIEQVIAETAQLEIEEEVTVFSRTEVGDQEEPRSDDMEHWFNPSYEEFVSSDTNRRFETASDTDGEPETVVSETVVQEETVQTAVVEKKTDDESLSLEETLLKISEDSVIPSVAGEITKIQFSKGISIKGVNEGEWYKASLPKIPANAKGKAPLKTVDQVRGNPAKEIFTLICVDVDFLVQKQEKIIDEVEQFFNSYSFRRMAALNPTEFYAKEEMVLSWAAVSQIVQIAASSVFEDQNVQLVINQRPHSPTTSDDSSMRFDDDEMATTPISLPAISTDLQASFAQQRASIEQLQFEQLRRKDDIEKLKDILLMHIRDLEKQVNARFDEHDRAYRALLTNIRKDIHDHKTALSLDVVRSHQKLSTQVAAAALDNVDVRKEVKEQRAMLTDLDGQVSTVRSELLDFRAKAEENHLNLSNQLGFLVDYINRGGDAKKGEGGSTSRPQPPPDDQARPSGGSASREGGNSGGRGSESSSGSKQRRGSGGESIDRKRSSGGGSGRVTYGPYLPPKRSAEYLVYGEKEF